MGALQIGVREDGQPFTLPLEFVRSRYAVVSISGYGKTILGTKMAEELLKQQQSFISFDVVGNWWGLRVGADGRSQSGFPIFVLGGRKADMPLHADQGRRYAHVLTSSPVSSVIDLSTTPPPDRWRFTADFCSELLMIQPDFDIHVFFEELKELASQMPRDKWHKKSTEAIDSFCTIGRNYGYGYTVIGQRTAIMAKGPLNQAGALFAMRLQGTQDIDAIMDWIENNGPNLEEFGGLKVFKKKLAKLEKGEAFYIDPSAPEPLVKIRVGKRQTLHPAEARRVNPKMLKTVDMVDVKSLVRQLTDTLNKEITKTQVDVPTPKDERKPRRELEAAPGPINVNLEMLKLSKQNEELETKVRDLTNDLQVERQKSQDALRRLANVRETMKPQYEMLRRLYEDLGATSAEGAADMGRYQIWMDKAKKEGMRAMLKYLVENGKATVNQLNTIAGVSQKTGYNYARWLIRSGLAQKEGKSDIVLRRI
jgi:hypothetical protein